MAKFSHKGLLNTNSGCEFSIEPMPQFIQFPALSGDPKQAVNALIRVCRQLSSVNSAKELRTLLKENKLWNKASIDDFLKFLQVQAGERIELSPWAQKLGESEELEELLVRRLWTVNPLLCKSILERLGQSVYSKQELFKQIDSSGYLGTSVAKPQLENWLSLALGLEVIKRVGVALALGPRASLLDDEMKDFDVDEFLEEDEPEKALAPFTVSGAGAEPISTSPVDVKDDATPRVVAPSRTVPVAQFSFDRKIEAASLDETVQRVQDWWKTKSDFADATVEEWGIEHEAWIESMNLCLFRICVGAILRFRLGKSEAEAIGVFRILDQSMLSDLFYGTAPASMPDNLNAQSLMLASLLARRFASHPELAETLEKQKSAKDAFDSLYEALGDGLLSVELFWVMRSLRDLSALRFDDMDDFCTLPTRQVRDVLFRLGFLPSPYATGIEELRVAAKAGATLAGAAPQGDVLIRRFSEETGCQFNCTKSSTCSFYCRETSA